MPQIFTCTNPHCGKKMTVPDELLGREVHCPHCVQRIQVGPKLALADAPATTFWFVVGVFLIFVGVVFIFVLKDFARLATPMLIASCGFLSLILSQVWRTNPGRRHQPEEPLA